VRPGGGHRLRRRKYLLSGVHNAGPLLSAGLLLIFFAAIALCPPTSS
jgi:hypothetical protein